MELAQIGDIHIAVVELPGEGAVREQGQVGAPSPSPAGKGEMDALLWDGERALLRRKSPPDTTPVSRGTPYLEKVYRRRMSG